MKLDEFLKKVFHSKLTVPAVIFSLLFAAFAACGCSSTALIEGCIVYERDPSTGCMKATCDCDGSKRESGQAQGLISCVGSSLGISSCNSSSSSCEGETTLGICLTVPGPWSEQSVSYGRNHSFETGDTVLSKGVFSVGIAANGEGDIPNILFFDYYDVKGFYKDGVLVIDGELHVADGAKFTEIVRNADKSVERITLGATATEKKEGQSIIVTFTSDDEDLIMNPVIVKIGSAIDYFPTPEIEGKTFIGWRLAGTNYAPVMLRKGDIFHLYSIAAGQVDRVELEPVFA